jgi:hypothetical protein
LIVWKIRCPSDGNFLSKKERSQNLEGGVKGFNFILIEG